MYAANSSSFTEDSTLYIKGTVVDENNEVIEGLTLIITGYSENNLDYKEPLQYLLESSDFHFSSLSSGKYLIRIQKRGFEQYERTIALKDNGVDLGKIVLKRLTSSPSKPVIPQDTIQNTRETPKVEIAAKPSVVEIEPVTFSSRKDNILELEVWSGYTGRDTSFRNTSDDYFYGVNLSLAPFEQILGKHFSFMVGSGLFGESGRMRIPIQGKFYYNLPTEQLIPIPLAVHIEGALIFDSKFEGSTKEPSLNPDDYSEYSAGGGLCASLLKDWLQVGIGYKYARINVRTPCESCGDKFIVNTNTVNMIIVNVGTQFKF